MIDSEARADVMLVDDTAANLDLLTRLLGESGYRVRPIPSGQLALAAAESQAPDIILLDVRMPDMDGYEVCRRLKANPQLCDVPVLFISALSEPLDKVKAFGVGGVDYVTKPFEPDEVLARIETQLALLRARRDLQQQNRSLRDLEALREDLVHMIVHDMRSPIAGILMTLKHVVKELPENVSPEVRVDLEMVIEGNLRLSRMVDEVLDVNRLETGHLTIARKANPVSEIVNTSLTPLRNALKQRHVAVEVPADLQMECDADLIVRVVTNLLTNAQQHTSTGGKVHISASGDGTHCTLRVSDDGRGIPTGEHERIFEKFAQVEPHEGRRRHSSGLGLAFCKLAVEAHGGSIHVESTEGEGCAFVVELPQPSTV